MEELERGGAGGDEAKRRAWEGRGRQRGGKHRFGGRKMSL